MNYYSRKRKKALGLWELIGIALGGMVGGGIFSILGISVEQVGNLAPVAIGISGLAIAGLLVLYFEYTHNTRQLFYILGIYGILALGSYLYSRRRP